MREGGGKKEREKRMGGRGREGLWLKEGSMTTPSLDLHLHKNILIRLRMDLKSVVFYFSFFLFFPFPVGFSAVAVM